MQPNQPSNYPSNYAYGQQPTPGASPFVDPTAGGGSALKVRNLEGRTVVFVPKSYNPSATDPSGKPRPSILTDVLVVDGPELLFGDNAEQHTPPTHRVSVPYFATGVILGNSEIVKALAPNINAVVLGVVVRGTQGNRPFLLNRIEPDSPARQTAANVWSARTLGTFANPEPIPLAPTPAPMPQQPTPAMGGYGAPNAVPAVQQQGYAYGQAATTGGVGGVGQLPATYGQPAFQQPQAAAYAAPPNWDPAVWQTLAPAAQQQILATLPAQPVVPAGGTGF